jgi:membrane-bound metal-dependent hydrolase YbcI (DUF457 family)
MTLLTHTTVSTAVGMTANYPVDYLECFVLGGLFPDIIESIVCLGSYKKFVKIHRQFFHWWIIYLIPLCFLLLFASVVPFYFVMHAVVFLLGCFNHLFFDLLTPTGIPLKKPTKRFSIKLYTTGHFGEWLIFVISVFFIYLRLNGGLI